MRKQNSKFQTPNSEWLAFVSVACLIMLGCTSPTNSNHETPAPSALRLSVEAQPASIPANGVSQMVIFTEFRDGDQPVADSTEIILLNTVGTLKKGVLRTQNGVALDTLTADTIAATGYVIAYSQGLRDTAQIRLTAR